MDDVQSPASLALRHWARTEESLQPTGSERLKGRRLSHHGTLGCLHTAGGDYPATDAEAGRDERLL